MSDELEEPEQLFSSSWLPYVVALSLCAAAMAAPMVAGALRRVRERCLVRRDEDKVSIEAAAVSLTGLIDRGRRWTEQRQASSTTL
jgi:hypothetical protein